MRRKHKPVLFDQLRLENRPARRLRRIFLYNGVMQLLHGVFRVLGILLASLAGSLFLTVLFAAVSQEVSMADAFVSLWEKGRAFFKL